MSFSSNEICIKQVLKKALPKYYSSIQKEEYQNDKKVTKLFFIMLSAVHFFFVVGMVSILPQCVKFFTPMIKC